MCGVGQADVDAEDVGVAGRGDDQAAHRLVDGAANPAVRLAELFGELLPSLGQVRRDGVEVIEDMADRRPGEFWRGVRVRGGVQECGGGFICEPPGLGGGAFEAEDAGVFGD